MPPISGWGMGIDRFVALLSGRGEPAGHGLLPADAPRGRDRRGGDARDVGRGAGRAVPASSRRIRPRSVSPRTSCASGWPLSRPRSRVGGGSVSPPRWRAAAAEADGRADVWAAAGLAKELGADALASAGAHPGLVGRGARSRGPGRAVDAPRGGAGGVRPGGGSGDGGLQGAARSESRVGEAVFGEEAHGKRASRPASTARPSAAARRSGCPWTASSRSWSTR
jgi:hypothetical protein